MVDVEPQPRIDTLTRRPDGTEVRRTDYAGTVWFDGKPEVDGLTLRRSERVPRGIRVPSFTASFFLPDSLRYLREALSDATLSLTMDLRAAGGTNAITDAAAVFTDDPSGAPTWVQIHVRGYLSWPAGVGYRVVALTTPDAVR